MIAEIGGPCLLRDGSMVEIRQVECGDAALLADGFARLSVRSRRLRFMRDKNRLTEAELRFLTCVDHHDHEAIGALGPCSPRSPPRPAPAWPAPPGSSRGR